jgi:hypothetical protein
MRDEDRGHPHRLRPDPHPAAVFLNVEAVGLVVVAAACFGAGAILSSGLCLVLAAVAGGLAASIAEGLPRSGAAVVGLEGVTVAFAMTWRSLPAAAASSP